MLNVERLPFEPVPHNRGPLFEYWVSGMIRMEMPNKPKGAKWLYAWDAGPTDKGRLTVLGLATGHRKDRDRDPVKSIRTYALATQGAEMSQEMALKIYDIFYKEHFAPARKLVGSAFSTCLYASSTFLGGFFLSGLRKLTAEFAVTHGIEEPWPKTLTAIELRGEIRPFVEHLCNGASVVRNGTHPGWISRFQKNAVFAARSVIRVNVVNGVRIPDPWLASGLVIKRKSNPATQIASLAAVVPPIEGVCPQGFVYSGTITQVLEALRS